MLMLFTVALVVVVALLRGGSLNNFSGLQLRWMPLVAAGLALQLLIFTPFREEAIISVATPQLYLLSMLIVAAWVGLNWRIPGMAIMAAGLLFNTLAIAANGGYMPVAPESARFAGRIENYATEGQPISNNSIATDEQVRLWILTDILALPKEVPFANVFSLGDVLLTVGAGALCYRTIRRKPDDRAPGFSPPVGQEPANEPQLPPGSHAAAQLADKRSHS